MRVFQQQRTARVARQSRLVPHDVDVAQGAMDQVESYVGEPRVCFTVVLDERVEKHPRRERPVEAEPRQIGGERALRQLDDVPCDVGARRQMLVEPEPQTAAGYALTAGPVFARFDAGIPRDSGTLVRTVLDRHILKCMLAGLDAQTGADGERRVEALVGAVDAGVQNRAVTELQAIGQAPDSRERPVVSIVARRVEFNTEDVLTYEGARIGGAKHTFIPP